MALRAYADGIPPETWSAVRDAMDGNIGDWDTAFRSSDDCLSFAGSQFIPHAPNSLARVATTEELQVGANAIRDLADGKVQSVGTIPWLEIALTILDTIIHKILGR